MDNRIGIVSMYINNLNYGGNLQAFALCYACRKMGFKVEQVKYVNSTRSHYLLSRAKTIAMGMLIKEKKLKIRIRVIKEFNQSIPHSMMYYKNTINKANSRYSAFIVGSDQVWNPLWLNQFYSLDFVENRANSISYAASIGAIDIPQEKLIIYKNIVNKINALSVREERAIELLQPLTTKEICCVLDPTMLLNEDEWLLNSKPYYIKDKYIFCYFLGEDKRIRDLAQEFAKQNNYKIVTLPYLNYGERQSDDNFGDHRLFDVGPKEFLFLIKQSEYVFTDSFHAVAFSHIFKKEFVVVNNYDSPEMRTRIDTIVNLFGTESRFLDNNEKKTINYINSLKKIDYSKNNLKFEQLKDYSIKFLLNNLNNSLKNK